jgi:hypothetical protein
VHGVTAQPAPAVASSPSRISTLSRVVQPPCEVQVPNADRSYAGHDAWLCTVSSSRAVRVATMLCGFGGRATAAAGAVTTETARIKTAAARRRAERGPCVTARRYRDAWIGAASLRLLLFRNAVANTGGPTAARFVAEPGSRGAA